MKLPIASITVGERRREELGDIPALARSIEKYGLLHPIVVSSQEGGCCRLVAGERRLKAFQHLGYESVEVTDVGDLDEATLREIELEENERRKDLTPGERSRQLLRRVQAAEESIRSKLDQLPIRPGPKPTGGVSRQDAAEAAGESKTTVLRTEEHVGILDANPDHPELAEMPQSVVLKIKDDLARASQYPELDGFSVHEKVKLVQAVEALPEDERQPVLAAVADRDDATITQLVNNPPKPAEPKRKRAKKITDPAEQWHEVIHDTTRLINSLRDHGGLVFLARHWSPEARTIAANKLRGLIASLETSIHEMEVEPFGTDAAD